MKYLLGSALPSTCHRGRPAYSRGFPVKPCIWLDCLFPVIIVATTFSVRLIRWGAGLGISIASLSTPDLVTFRSVCGSSWYLTRFGCPLRRLGTGPPNPLLSDELLNLICNGSSSSASCSARSPVSLHKENLDPADSEECRLPCFSRLSGSKEVE